ncbi:hypothetical protein DFH09DRAFT_1333634 [Mycena vulgaris]|nr:hypothetical protein DFH09DRAFT_1333634 [Mycena vulgaris]
MESVVSGFLRDFSGDEMGSIERVPPSTTLLIPPAATAEPSNLSTICDQVKAKKKRSRAQQQCFFESRRQASARFREKNCDKVLEAGRLHAAKRRAAQKRDEEARARAREASAQYRARNRDELAQKQRLVRKRAFLKKYGLSAHIQRRFDAPISSREQVEDELEPFVNDDAPDPAAPIFISDYNDSFLHRCVFTVDIPVVGGELYLRTGEGRIIIMTLPLPLSFFSSTLSLSLLSPPIPGLLLMPCTPPYYPSRSHEDQHAHDRCSGYSYYMVMEGQVRGGYSNSWIARDQTDSWSDSSQKACKNWADTLHVWENMCRTNHTDGCPPFEPVTFTLDPDPRTHPSSPPCSCLTAPAPTASSSTSSYPSSCLSYPSSLSSSSSDAAGTPLPSPLLHPSPVALPSCVRASAGPSSNTTVCVAPPPTPRTVRPCTPTAAPSPFTQSGSPLPKKEEETPPSLFMAVPRVTSSMRVQLTSTGHSVAARLPPYSPHPIAGLVMPTPGRTTAQATPSAAAPAVHGFIVSVVAMPAAAAAPPVAGPTAAAAHSLLATPAAGAGPAPAAVVRQYGVRGVGIFYDTWESVHTAAKKLGMDNSKIMVTENHDKLEAWILGKPFVGEDKSV